MVSDRATSARSQTPLAISWPQGGGRSYGSHRHPLCAQKWHRLGRFSAGDGLFRHDTTESSTPVAQGGRLGAAASPHARQTAGSRQDRFLPSHRRFHFSPCVARREKTGKSPVDRRKNGSKHHL